MSHPNTLLQQEMDHIAACVSSFVLLAHSDFTSCVVLLAGCVTTSLFSECRAVECESCFSWDFCTKCKPGFLLHKGKCLTSCPEGTFGHQTDCLGKHWRRLCSYCSEVHLLYIHTFFLYRPPPYNDVTRCGICFPVCGLLVFHVMIKKKMICRV